MEPSFYYDLGKNPIYKNWKGVFIIIGISLIVIFSIDLISTIQEEGSDFLDFFSRYFKYYMVYSLFYMEPGNFIKKVNTF